MVDGTSALFQERGRSLDFNCSTVGIIFIALIALPYVLRAAVMMMMMMMMMMMIQRDDKLTALHLCKFLSQEPRRARKSMSCNDANAGCIFKVVS